MERITRSYDYIEYFIEGGREQKKCNSLNIKGDRLFSYNTVIAEWKGDYKIIVNMTKYSTTTSTAQNKLIKELEEYYKWIEIIKVYDIEVNTQYLEEFKEDIDFDETYLEDIYFEEEINFDDYEI